METTFDEIYAALSLRPGMDETLIRSKAKALYEVLATIDWKLFKIEQPIGVPIPGTDKQFPLVEYTFQDSRRSIENAREPLAFKRSLSQMDGTGIDREDIHYFAKVCQIGQSLIPHLWPTNKKILDALIAPNTHLDTLNEVWWLARWSGIDWSATQNEYPLRANEMSSRFRDKSVDWRLRSLDDWAINVDVKNFARAHADRTYDKVPSFYRANGLTRDGKLDTDDPRLKFRRSGAKEINVLVVTWYDEIGSEFERWIEDFLDASSFPSDELAKELSDKIDAVVIWSRPDQRRNGWRRLFPRIRDISAKREALMRFLVEPDEEDRNRPWSQRFAYSLPEAIEAAQHGGPRIIKR